MFTERRLAPSEVELDEDTERCSGNVFKSRRRISLGIHGMTSRATDDNPLDLRAWALQERELATRLVSFTGAELQWSCRHLQTCGCRRIPSPAQPLFPYSTPLSSHSIESAG